MSATMPRTLTLQQTTFRRQTFDDSRIKVILFTGIAQHFQPLGKTIRSRRCHMRLWTWWWRLRLLLALSSLHAIIQVSWFIVP